MADTTDQPDADAIAETTRPPAMTPEGVALDGGYPANLRLRAEALVADGKAEDPLGHVTPEFIAATAERLEAEAKDAAERARQAEAGKPSLSWTKADLAAEAVRLGVPVEGDANKAAILAAIEGAASASSSEG